MVISDMKVWKYSSLPGKFLLQWTGVLIIWRHLTQCIPPLFYYNYVIAYKNARKLEQLFLLSHLSVCYLACAESAFRFPKATFDPRLADLCHLISGRGTGPCHKKSRNKMKAVFSLLALALAASSVQANVVELTDSDFDSELEGMDTALVMFYAPW